MVRASCGRPLSRHKCRLPLSLEVWSRTGCSLDAQTGGTGSWGPANWKVRIIIESYGRVLEPSGAGTFFIPKSNLLSSVCISVLSLYQMKTEKCDGTEVK